MGLKLFDSHTHIQFAAFEKDYKEVIRRALDNGVGLINVGTQKDTSRRAVEVAYEFEKLPIYATVGIHPIHTFQSFHDAQELSEPFPNSPASTSLSLSGRELANGSDGFINRGKLFSNSRELENSGGASFVSRAEEFDYDYYKKIALDFKVVAIGECGLDYYRVTNDMGHAIWQERLAQEGQGSLNIIERQKEAFIKQIELAHDVKKPLMIHCRDAYGDLIDILNTKYKILNTTPGIIHFFSGSVDEVKKLLDMGFYFTFGGTITYPHKGRGTNYSEIIDFMPMDRILSETDAPYVAPVPYRGKRNEPAYVVEIVKKLAEIKNIPLDVMREQILENTKRVFGIDF